MGTQNFNFDHTFFKIGASAPLFLKEQFSTKKISVRLKFKKSNCPLSWHDATVAVSFVGGAMSG